MSKLIKDINGDAAVEAVILFPIMIMIFAALVLLAMYLPTRAALQRATQYAATAIATEESDTWLFFDIDSLSYKWEEKKSNLRQVYAGTFSSGDGIAYKVEDIVTGIEDRSVSSKAGTLSVDSYVVNKVIYKEVVVTATRKFDILINLSFIQFPESIPVTVTSTAVVQNGDEFVRNMDMAVDYVEYITKKYDHINITDSIGSYGEKVSSLLGWDDKDK